MSGADIGFLSILVILVLIYTGMHVPIAFCVVSLLGVWAIKGSFEQSSKLLALAAADSVSSYDFGVIPLFVLMGMLVAIADLGRDAFLAANALLGRLKGGLGVATVGANAVFAAVTGVSIASAAVFTKIAVPEMIRLGYQPRFAVGVVAGSSVLGMLIPPSLLLIIYGLLAEQSIGDLFIAGIVPGLLLATAFAIQSRTHRHLQAGSRLCPCWCRRDGCRARRRRGAPSTGAARVARRHGHRRHLCRLVHGDRIWRGRRAGRPSARALATQADVGWAVARAG